MGVIAIKKTDIVHSQEASFKNIIAFRILSVDPPGEIEKQLVKDGFQEIDVALSSVLVLLDLIHPVGSPCMDRRIGIAEGPFISRKLAIRMHIPVMGEQQ